MKKVLSNLVIGIQEIFNMTKIKTGDIVRITGPCSYYGLSQYSKMSTDDKVICRAVATHPGSTYNAVTIKDDVLGRMWNISDRSLEIISEEEMPEYEAGTLAFVEKLAVIKKKYLKDFQETFLKPQPLSKRDFTHENINVSTNYNYLQLGKYNETDKSFTSHSNNFGIACCACTKNGGYDFNVFIPKLYSDKFGHSEKFLIEWLKFLGESEMEFNYEYFGLQDLPEEFKPSVLKYEPSKYLEKEEYHVSINDTLTATSIVPKLKDYYRVVLKSTGDAYKNYANFIVLRYIYNNLYYSIPGTARQIKQTLGDSVSNWEALLIAHLRMDYYYYYSFMNNKTGGDTNSGYGNGDAISGMWPNVFQSYESLFTSAKSTFGLNPRFTYNLSYDRRTVNEYFATKNYKGLLDYLKNEKNK